MTDGDASDQSGVAGNRRRMDAIVDGERAALPATNVTSCQIVATHQANGCPRARSDAYTGASPATVQVTSAAPIRNRRSTRTDEVVFTLTR